MVLHDLGYLPFEEPVKSFRAHGIITKDGGKMSKSKGNVVNPDEIINRFGADSFRLYLMFLGPFTLGGDWQDQGIVGCRRYIDKMWDLASQGANQNMPESCERTMHRSIKKVRDDIEQLSYNTAIAQLMTYVNELRSADARHPVLLDALLRMTAPFTPFVAEELWQKLGHTGANDSVFKAGWPAYDESKTIENTVTVVIMINGKKRGQMQVARNTEDKVLIDMALSDSNVTKYTEKGIVKTVVVPNKLVNIVAK
jgi:leucyl-tRNA synthetase